MKPLITGPGSIVIADLQNPKEKYWGVLLDLTQAGVWMKGLYLDTFDTWLRQVMEDSGPIIGLGSFFFPMLRIERLSLDKSIGGIPSYAEIFQRKIGRDLMELIYEAEIFEQKIGKSPIGYMDQETENVARNFITIPLGKSLREIEDVVILKTLGWLGNNKTALAKVLGVDRKTICVKLKSLGIPEEDNEPEE